MTLRRLSKTSRPRRARGAAQPFDLAQHIRESLYELKALAGG
jgi:hypothetical protein